MSASTDRAREKLQVLLDIGSDQEFGAYCDLLMLAIKQYESLRGEHMRRLYDRTGATWHYRAVDTRDYMSPVNDIGCRECLVLLQWEQMWEEKK